MSLHERVEDNFPAQALGKPSSSKALLELVLSNAEELLQEVQTAGSLHCGDHALVESMVLRNTDLENSRSLNFRRAKFRLIKELLDEILWEAVLGGERNKTELSAL